MHLELFYEFILLLIIEFYDMLFQARRLSLRFYADNKVTGRFITLKNDRFALYKD